MGSPDQELERAIADYLRVSRGAHLYASADEHARAEEAAWNRLVAARDAADADATTAAPSAS